MHEIEYKTNYVQMKIDENKPIWQLTIGEFMDMMTFTIGKNEKTVIKELPKFLTVSGLAKLTGYSISTINIKNSRKEIPGSKKLNGRVLFDTEKILEWIESESVRKPTKEEQLEFFERNFSKGKRRQEQALTRKI